MTITPEAMREMAKRLEALDESNWMLRLGEDAAEMLRSIAAEREADNVTHEWCGDEPNPKGAE